MCVCVCETLFDFVCMFVDFCSLEGKYWLPDIIPLYYFCVPLLSNAVSGIVFYRPFLMMENVL